MSEQDIPKEDQGLIIRGRIQQIEHTIKALTQDKVRLIRKCPHVHIKHWPRQVAEDDPWDQCIDCGREVI